MRLLALCQAIRMYDIVDTPRVRICAVSHKLLRQLGKEISHRTQNMVLRMSQNDMQHEYGS